MKYVRVRSGRHGAGFALPTILIVSVVMMTLLMTAAGALTSSRASLDAQSYNLLAREAAEAGVARAQECLEQNGYIPQWGAQSLRPNTSCSGGAACTNAASCFVVNGAKVRSTFSVGAPVDQTISQLVTVVGTVELLRPSGDVRSTYTYTVTAKIGVDLNLNSVVFGYINTTISSTVYSGAFFFTIANDGVLRGTGYNAMGQLGNGTTSTATEPRVVNLPEGVKALSVYASFLSAGRNAFVIASDGKLYAMGNNSAGQLGNGLMATSQSVPVVYGLPNGKRPRHVASLGTTTYAVTTDDNIYAAGACEYGVLGDNFNPITSCVNRSTPVRVNLPTPSADLNTRPTNNIETDRCVTYVRMQGGKVYGWGCNARNQLVDGTTNDSSNPKQIGPFGNPGQPKAVQMVTDGSSVWILDSNGDIKAGGHNFAGQLGDGTTIDRAAFVDVQIPASAGKVVKMSTDAYSMSALTANGEVWCVGENTYGQLGNGSLASATTLPEKFILPAGVKAVDVYNTATGGAANVFVVGDNGRVYGAGQNDYGQLGDGTTIDRPTPVVMNVINGSSVRAQQVQSGYGTTVVLTTNKKIYTVGNNAQGQLGDGTTINSSTPRANRYTNILPVTSF